MKEKELEEKEVSKKKNIALKASTDSEDSRMMRTMKILVFSLTSSRDS